MSTIKKHCQTKQAYPKRNETILKFICRVYKISGNDVRRLINSKSIKTSESFILSNPNMAARKVAHSSTLIYVGKRRVINCKKKGFIKWMLSKLKGNKT